MFGAESLFLPGVRVPAIAAPTHIPLEPHLVTLVVPQFKALLADNARGVLFACLAFPCHVSVRKSFGAYAFAGRTTLFQFFDRQMMVDLSE